MSNGLPELNHDLPCGGQHILYRSIVRDKVQPLLARHVASLEVRYLDYLNKVAPENRSLKTEGFPDQKRAPSTPNSSIYNRNPFSQAGRRGFEPVSRSKINNLQTA